MIKVGPLASEVDATSRVSTLEARMTKRINEMAQARLTSVESGILSRANTTYVGVEHVILAGRASGRNFKDVAGSVGGVYFAITCSGPHDGWTWSEVVDIAERQRLKILSGGAT